MWTVTSARSDFARLLEEAIQQPQAIARRGQLVGWVLSAPEYAQLQADAAAGRQAGFGLATQNIVAACGRAEYALDTTPRADRANPFADDS